MLTKLKINGSLKILAAICTILFIGLFAIVSSGLYLNYIIPSNTITKYQVVCIVPTGQVFSSQSPDIAYVERIENGISIITSDGSEVEVINTSCTIAKTEELLVKPVP